MSSYRFYDLVPIAAEDYSGNELAMDGEGDEWMAPSYYSVAVARRTSSYLTIFNLRSKIPCS